MKIRNRILIGIIAASISNVYASTIVCPPIIECKGDSHSTCKVSSNRFAKPSHIEGTYHKGVYRFVSVNAYELDDEKSVINCTYNGKRTLLTIKSKDLLVIDYDYLTHKSIWYWQVNRAGSYDGSCYHSPSGCEIRIKTA